LVDAQSGGILIQDGGGSANGIFNAALNSTINFALANNISATATETTGLGGNNWNSATGFAPIASTMTRLYARCISSSAE